MDKHIQLLGILYIASGVLGILVAIVAFWVIAGPGLASGDAEAIAILSTVATAIAGFFFIFSVPEIIAGVGLLKRQNWARILALVMGGISLIEIPIGTALGIYTFWVLLKDECIREFERGGAPPSSVHRPHPAGGAE